MNKKLIAILVAALAIAGGGYLYSQKQTAQAVSTDASEVLPAHLADRILGDTNAPVTIMEYANFTCSHCGDLHRTMFPKLKSEYIDTGKVKLVYREIIIDGPGVMATSLARCVPEEQYFGMAAVLYENQQTWAFGQTTIEGVREALKKYASLAGLPAEQFDKCLDNKDLQKEMIEHSQKNAEADKVQGTPSLYINGKPIEGKWDFENLKPQIEAALK